MANIQIKDLPEVTSLQGSDIFHVNLSATDEDRRITFDNIQQALSLGADVEGIYSEATNLTVTRLAPHTVIDARLQADTVITIDDTQPWEEGDTITINKSVTAFLLTINSGTYNMVLPDNVSGNIHFIPAGVAMNITLTRQTTNNWSVTIKGGHG